MKISWFWDGGIDVRLGYEISAYMAEENVQSVCEIVPWLQEDTAHFYPTSTYAVSLGTNLTNPGELPRYHFDPCGCLLLTCLQAVARRFFFNTN